MRLSGLSIAFLCLAGCTHGPRASMFAPVGGSPVQLMTPEADPFLQKPAATVAPDAPRLKTPALPKLGPISSAARVQMWQAANSIGPQPRSLPSSIPLSESKKTPASEAIGATVDAKHVEARPTSKLKTDGQRGFVQLLPPPPDDVGGSAEAPRESRFFELPPAPEN